MAARLTRAKKKIVLAGIPIGAPLEDELRSRLDEVCRTIYLAFTAGYTPGAGPDLLRADLAGEAVRLAAVLHDLVPDATQVRATLALLLLQHSRRYARQRHGRLVTLADQDRSVWHDDEIRIGLRLAAGLRPDEGFAEELHSKPSSPASTRAHPPPQQRTGLRSPGTMPTSKHEPVLRSRLNHAVAVAEVEGPRAGLALIVGLDEILRENHRVAAVRAELARRLGDTELARTSYRKAIGLCSNDIERTHLSLRARLDILQTPTYEHSEITSQPGTPPYAWG